MPAPCLKINYIANPLQGVQIGALSDALATQIIAMVKKRVFYDSVS